MASNKGEMTWRARAVLFGWLALLTVCPGAALPANSVVDNLTGLPAYPNLTSAAMEKLLKTETFGRWCARFTGATSDPLSIVESWYRKALIRASETDLAKDNEYKIYANLSGIKLALGIDYVAIYRASNQQTTIELHRCSWTH
jgi:hypothetical protein